MLFLGIEIAANWVRALVVDLRAASIEASAYESFDFVSGLPPEHCEQEASHWIKAVDLAVRACLQQLGSQKNQLCAMGVSGQPNSLVLLDETNSLVRPAKTQADRSANAQREALSRTFGGIPGWIELTGTTIRDESLAAKLLWLHEKEPYHFRKTSTVMQSVDFINYWLTGIKKMERSGAMRSGLVNLRRETWTDHIIDFIDESLREKLPPIGDGKGLGFLRPEVAQSWGLEQKIWLSAGGSNELMRSLAAGVVNPGVALIDVGETAQVRVVSEQFSVDSRGEIRSAKHVNNCCLLIFEEAQASQSLSALLAHYHWNESQLESAVSEAVMGADGLLFLPPKFEGGEGLLYGLNGKNFSPANVARATMEGLALNIDYGLSCIRELGGEVNNIRVAGTCANSRVWRQMLANMTSCPVTSLRKENTAAFGAAMQAAASFLEEKGEKLGFSEISDYFVSPDASSLCEPNGEQGIFYEKLLARQRYLAETLTGTGFLVK